MPDAIRRALTATPRWERLPSTARDRWSKQRALLAYRSQFRLFGKRLLVGIALYEWGWGGEAIGRLPQADAVGGAQLAVPQRQRRHRRNDRSDRKKRVKTQ